MQIKKLIADYQSNALNCFMKIIFIIDLLAQKFQLGMLWIIFCG